MSDKRDRQVESALRRRLSDTTSSDGDCLDAETAAAWADGTLAGDQLREARRHAADCSRCQMLMATLLATEGAASDVADTARAFEARDYPTKSAWSPLHWRSWTVALATAATVLIAAAIWLRTPDNPQRPAADRVDTLLPAARQRAENATAVPQPAQPAQAPRVDARPRAESTSDNKPATTSSSALQQAGAAPPAAEPSAAPAPPNISRSTSAFRTAQAPAAAAKALDALAPTSTEAISPNTAVRWRIVQGAVQKTADGGATWQPVALPLQATIAAVAAPASSTCWLVGASGVVLVTFDGVTWTRVPFPETVNLTGVVADTSGATITTADGRRFESRDGGASWTLISR